MILFRNRLVFGVIKRILVSVFRAIYAVISLFNLQTALLVALTGLILYFTGVFERSNALLIIFYILLIASVVLAIVLTIRRLLGLGGKREKRRKPQIVYEEEKAQPKPEAKEDSKEVAFEQEKPPIIEEPVKRQEVYPKFYQVKQNAAYVMAEYEDRYELYVKERTGLRRVRIDYKRTEQ